MPFDQAPKIKTSHRPKWDLPEIAGVRTRATEYRPRASRNFKTPLSVVQRAVEIIVSFKAPVPARAISPVLYIGDTRLTESEQADEQGRELRFWSFEPSRLLEGAPIRIFWMGEQPKSEAKNESRFKYSLPTK